MSPQIRSAEPRDQEIAIAPNRAIWSTAKLSGEQTMPLLLCPLTCWYSSSLLAPAATQADCLRRCRPQELSDWRYMRYTQHLLWTGTKQGTTKGGPKNEA